MFASLLFDDRQALIQASDKKRKSLENKFDTKLAAKDRQWTSLENKFDAKLAAKDRQCNNIIIRNNRRNEQLVLDVEKNADVKLAAAKMEVKIAHKEIRTLQLKSARMFQQQKLRHKKSLSMLQQASANDARRKEAKLMAMSEEVEGMHEMMYQMLDEVKESNRSEKVASGDAVAAQSRVYSLTRKVQAMTLVCAELKDEIADEYNNNAELQKKVDEYEVIIDTMQREYEEKVADYDSIIAYMDSYYEDTMRQLQPRFIMKHWVKNKTRGEKI
jgi:hypothetical protein